MMLHHIATRLINTPLLITPEYGSVVTTVLADRINVQPMASQEVVQGYIRPAAGRVTNKRSGIVTMPVVGDAVEALQRFFDTSLADPIFTDLDHTSLPWPPAPAGAAVPAGWSAPWVVRDDAAQLGVPLLAWEQSVRQDLRVGIVGHSHRPGISWTEVADGQSIPLVDAGSWTYGRTSFAVVGSDGVGVAELAS